MVRHLPSEMRSERSEGENGEKKERKERKKEEESKTNGKSIMGHKRRAKWLRAEGQNRDNTVSENTPEGEKD